MQTVLEALRTVLGEADFYKVLYGNNPTWDYGAMIEYFVGALILLITVSSVFKFLLRLTK
jgi:hypothetical protein